MGHHPLNIQFELWTVEERERREREKKKPKKKNPVDS